MADKENREKEIATGRKVDKVNYHPNERTTGRFCVYLFADLDHCIFNVSVYGSSSSLYFNKQSLDNVFSSDITARWNFNNAILNREIMRLTTLILIILLASCRSSKQVIQSTSSTEKAEPCKHTVIIVTSMYCEDSLGNDISDQCNSKTCVKCGKSL